MTKDDYRKRWAIALEANRMKRQLAEMMNILTYWLGLTVLFLVADIIAFIGFLTWHNDLARFCLTSAAVVLGVCIGGALVSLRTYKRYKAEVEAWMQEQEEWQDTDI